MKGLVVYNIMPSSREKLKPALEENPCILVEFVLTINVHYKVNEQCVARTNSLLIKKPLVSNRNASRCEQDTAAVSFRVLEM